MSISYTATLVTLITRSAYSKTSVTSSNLGNLQAYKHKKRYPQYLFLFLGWYDENWWTLTGEAQESVHELYPDCTSEHIASVVPYSLAPLLAEFLVDQNESTVTDSGIVSFFYYNMDRV